MGQKPILTTHTGCTAQCGNYGTLVSHLFGKNFVKAMSFTKQITKGLI